MRPTRLIALLASLALVACADHGSDADPADIEAKAATVTFTVGGSCENPCDFSVKVGAGVDRVDYSADGWTIGSSSDAASDFAISYTFNVVGVRKITAVATSGGIPVGSAEVSVEVLEAGASGACETYEVGAGGSCWAAAEALGCGVEALVNHTGARDCSQLWAGDVLSCGCEGGAQPAPAPAPEQNPGPAPGQRPDVPYFYQYSNALHPGASCQNTSLSMVLAWLGWGGRPDDVTGEFGKNYAQSPAGLADVFNILARRAGIGERLTPITNGSLAGLRAQLDAGRPTIVHGYFTGYGHVLVVVGYDAGGYYVNDPAGRWAESFKGGYPYGWNASVGKDIYYERAAFERAIATDGWSSLPLWYHQLR